MEFTNEFRVPTDVDTTFETLTDLEKVAPCLPGASLEEVDGDAYKGQVKVRVGPMQMIYKGTARVVEADRATKRGRIEATGNETRGSGTAKADVLATLVEDGDGTLVTVVTDLQITGKPAQFGRGVLAEVGSKIISTFADRLREMLESDAATGSDGLAPEDEVTKERSPYHLGNEPQRRGDALDLVQVAGSATVKRLVPVVAATAIAAGFVWWFGSR